MNVPFKTEMPHCHAVCPAVRVRKRNRQLLHAQAGGNHRRTYDLIAQSEQLGAEGEDDAELSDR